MDCRRLGLVEEKEQDAAIRETIDLATNLTLLITRVG